MCGILGVIGGHHGAHTRKLEHTLSTLHHRGPDASGLTTDKDVAFGHTLLSIIGKRPVRQPLNSKDGHILLTYNGEIYNYPELIKGDAALAARCSGQSDSQVLVEGLSLYGLEFVERLNGIFAFSFLDRRTRDVFLVRDRLGVKPLYWGARKGTVAFASEQAVVLDLLGLETRYDLKGLYSYLRYRYPIGEGSFFSGVHTLPPASILTISAGHVSRQSYWSPYPAEVDRTADLSTQTAVSQALLTDSIRIQMRSDHSFCTFLSGGLDSSYLTAAARRQKAALDTFAVAVPERDLDEGLEAARTAATLQCDHHTLSVTGETFRDELRSLIRRTRCPIAVPNQVALSLLAAEVSRTHKCVLSGEGADEIFGGYGRIFLLPHDWLQLAGFREGGHVPSQFADRFKAVYGRLDYGDFASLLIDRYAYVSQRDASDLLRNWAADREIQEAHEAVTGELRAAYEGLENLDIGIYDRTLIFFQRVHLPGLLNRLDIATMSHGVEGRVPFLDHRLVLQLNSIPFSLKSRKLSTFAGASAEFALAPELSEQHDEPKALLRSIAKDVVPDEVLQRSKRGFPMPASFYGEKTSSSTWRRWLELNFEYLMEGV